MRERHTSNRPRFAIAALAVLAALAFAPRGGFAAGDQPPPSFPKPNSESKAKTPKPKPKPKPQASALPDDQIYSLGYWQAKGGDHATALATLRSASNQADPRIQTMIAYCLRKLGRVEEALPYYFAALAADPKRTTTRQYLGEAYLQIGQPDQAKQQLAEIAKRCGIACEDYQLLKDAIAKFDGTAG
jgi:tetratricopeptide (TPR) repeat protein